MDDNEKIHFWREGYIVVKGVFTSEEMNIVRQKIIQQPIFNDRVKSVISKQTNGEHPSFHTISVWNDTDGVDIYSKIGKSYKILDRMSNIFDDDVYCYHNKIALKYPGIVGFNPHQDYYYWNLSGVPFPESHAAFIAIDECTIENGCLQVVPKSHLLGLLPHDNWGRGDSDNGIKSDVYESLFNKGYSPVPMIMEPGDVCFFHGNTIHLSDDNNSKSSRLAMLVTLNTKRASPIMGKNIYRHPYYTHQTRVFDNIT